MKIYRMTWFLFLGGLFLTTENARSATDQNSKVVTTDWIKESNAISESFAKEFGQLVPESASSIGYTEFDSLGSEVSLKKEKEKEQFYKKWAGILGKKITSEKTRNLKIDLEILLGYVKNNIEAIKVGDEVGDIGFYDGSKMVFNEIQALINPQSPAERKKSAVDRFKFYVHGKGSVKPMLMALEAFVKEKEKKYKTKKFYPLRSEIELYLAESKDYVEGVKELLSESGRDDWKDDFLKFEEQVKNYDEFIKNDQLKKARSDFKLPPKVYQYVLKMRGMDGDYKSLIEVGRRDYKEIYKDFASIAKEVAAKHSLKESDPASVIKFLKSKPIVSASEAEKTYHDVDKIISKIITDHKIIKLPESPLKIRIAGDAESKASPVPHLTQPPLINNTGERPEFVVPSSSTGTLPFDDFSYNAAAYVLVAHEGRPGHDLQFSSMLDNGVSVIRSRYAANNVNIEGWAVYAEDLVYPHLPREGKLAALQMRLWRIARMFLDPEVQTGVSKQDEVTKIFTGELGVSPVMSKLEFNRYTFKDVGQAPSYYYGLLMIRRAKEKVKNKLGASFSESCFNNAVISLGLLPLEIIERELLFSLDCKS
jgi:hypothetical protein